ncbi:hypothetical protein LOD99_1279 [Oopsacas minuta]|uniref:Uncharacterized protein n=1 Tax=Oopsacas minuta TaxID=111878 RepID=A0AAV7K6X8_9METZ|nr:hypothetical protein LOD99_1279 [Oopsacas minuta]
MTTCTKSESASEKNTKKVSEITLNFTEEINKLNVCFEDKNIPNILVQLRVLMKHVNSKPNVRSFRDLQGLKLLVTILIYYTRDYVIQSHMEHSQLISLIVGILGNCCIQSNLVQSSILSNDTLKCLINILSDGEIENRGKLWSDVVKLLFVLKVHKPHHIELLCELGLVEMLLGAFNREDNKSIMSVIKLFTGLTHSLHICVRMIDTSGITILLEYSHRIEEDSTIIEVSY